MNWQSNQASPGYGWWHPSVRGAPRKNVANYGRRGALDPMVGRPCFALAAWCISGALGATPPAPYRLDCAVGARTGAWPVLVAAAPVMDDDPGLHWSPGAGQAIALLLCVGGVAALTVMPGRRWRARMRYAQRHWLWLLFFACSSGNYCSDTSPACSRLWPYRLGLTRFTMWQLCGCCSPNGALPHTLDPYVPGGVFDYHWGFHVPLAWLAWLLRRTDHWR